MTLRKEKLEGFKKELLARRTVLSREIQQATAEWIDDEPSFADSVDAAAADSGRAVAVEIKNRERGVLAQIDEAINRIENGSFGSCESCGEEIAVARLRANPSTTLCIDCKVELESEQQRYSNRG